MLTPFAEWHRIDENLSIVKLRTILLSVSYRNTCTNFVASAISCTSVIGFPLLLGFFFVHSNQTWNTIARTDCSRRNRGTAWQGIGRYYSCYFIFYIIRNSIGFIDFAIVQVTYQIKIIQAPNFNIIIQRACY